MRDATGQAGEESRLVRFRKKPEGETPGLKKMVGISSDSSFFSFFSLLALYSQ